MDKSLAGAAEGDSVVGGEVLGALEAVVKGGMGDEA